MTFTLYILNALVWSVAGFLVGYVVARMSKDVHTIKEAVVDREKTEPGPYLPTRLFGVVLVVMAIATVAAIAISNVQQQQVFDCQTDVNRELVRATNQRADFAARDRKALTDMLTTVLTEPNERARREAVEDYVAASEHTQGERSRSPLPDVEEFDC